VNIDGACMRRGERRAVPRAILLPMASREPASGVAPSLSIREVAARTGITTHTLRYYERIGLVQPVARARSGHRRYDDADLRWLELLKKLHATDMPIRKMLEYARLVRRGESTVSARRALLDAHRTEVLSKVAQLHSTLAVIEMKIAMYDQAIREGREATYVAAATG
jgi:DNA-binding transcriptional MerR regulator